MSADVQKSGQLALDVYRKCRDCQGEYRNLADDARQLHYTLQDIGDAIGSRELEASKQAELKEHIPSCDQVLTALSTLVEKYNGLPTSSKRTYDRLGWDQDGAKELEADLKKSVASLSEFYKSLVSSPQAQIERALEQLAEEISNGRHETSSVASLTTASDYDDDSGWMEVVRDLSDMGVDEKIVAEYRTFIVDWILRAINSGTLSEKIPVEDEKSVHISTPPPLPPKIPSPHPGFASLASPPATGPLRVESKSYPSYPPPVSPAAQAPQPVDYYSQQQAPGPSAYQNLSLSVSQDALSRQRPSSWDEPPSPIEPEPQESNILWTAQRIVEHWRKREWRQARVAIEQQILQVERGEYVEIGDGPPMQPDIRILRHLAAVCYSFSGDFLKAKDAFEAVLQGVYVQGLPMDDGDIAAARWLGETCVYLNQPLNAALAWAIAFHGLITKYPFYVHMKITPSQRMLDDIRYLNQKTSGLNALRNSVQRTNRDASTILPRMRGTDKFQIVLTALDSLTQNTPNHMGSLHIPQVIDLAEGFLIQPLVAQNSWPFQQDPFFQMTSSVNLLSILSRQKQEFIYTGVTSTSLGNSKNLTFVTKQPLKWLVEAVRYALNTYAIEWKVQNSTYLLRLSQTHERIAYYDCFSIHFRKLSLRKVYGIKITEPLYSTRKFSASGLSNDPQRNEVTETARKEVIRKELADRLKDYLEQAERDVAAGKWPPVDVPFVNAPYEMSSGTAFVEMSGESASTVAELPGASGVRRKPVGGMPNFEIAELPAEPYR